jgi:hypothetical protein
LPRFEIAMTDDQHGVHLHLLSVLHLAVNLVARGINRRAHSILAELALDRPGVIDERYFIADRQDADLLGAEPEREVSCIVLDEEANESLVRAERRAVNTEWCGLVFSRVL